MVMLDLKIRGIIHECLIETSSFDSVLFSRPNSISHPFIEQITNHCDKQLEEIERLKLENENLKIGSNQQENSIN